MAQIYFHDVTSSYPPAELKDLPGVPTYSARVLASTTTDDVVVLPHETRDHLAWILDHYSNIGLQCAHEVVFGGYEVISQYPKHELNVSFFGDKAHEARPNLKRLAATRDMNSKINFINTCKGLGVSVPKTQCFTGQQDYRYADLRFEKPPVFVKKAVSASGFGVFRCDNFAVMRSVISGLDVPFQIQEALPAGTEFLNVQYEVDASGELHRGPITHQILEGNTHSGNYFPIKFDPETIYQVTDNLGVWMATIGLRGIFAFDVAVTPTGEVLPIECNPRCNGATYYSSVAKRFGVEAWESRNIDFPKQTFEGFSLGELAFNRKSNEGIIIVNWGCVGDGKVGVFVAGSPQVRQNYLVELKHRL